MKKKLFITDFDGTLLTDDKTVSDQDLATLSRLREQGVITAVATGRSFYSFKRALEDINLEGRALPVDYLIFSTGAGIMELERGVILRNLSISTPDIQRICAYFDEVQLDYMVHRAIPDTPYFLYSSHGRENPDFFRRIELYKDFASPLHNGTPMFESATQVLAVVPGRLPASMVDDIKASLAGYSVIHATSPLDHASSWIEVFNEKVSKSQSAAWLASRLNIDREQVISVGNDYNDQDLLEWSGRGYLVANGAHDLNSCFRMDQSNNQDGVTLAAGLAGLLDTPISLSNCRISQSG